MTFEKLHLIDELPHATKRQLPATFNKMKPPRDTILQTLGSSDINKTRHMMHPEPLPYQTRVFKSSTLTKRVQIPRRHEDSFTCLEPPFLRRKGVILHSSRYAWDQMHRADKISQRERLLLEKEEMEKARDMKRNRELVNYREKYNLLLGGERIGSLSYISDHGKDEPHLSTPQDFITHGQGMDNSYPILSRDPSQTNFVQPQLSAQQPTHSTVNNMKQVLRAGAAISSLPPTLWENEHVPSRISPKNLMEESVSPTNAAAAYSMAVAAQKLKLLGRSGHMSSDNISRPHEQSTSTSILQNSSEDWKHVPRIPFPFYFGMTSSAASTSEWDNYLTRQQKHLHDITDLSKHLGDDKDGHKGFIQQYIMDGNRANLNERTSVIEELNFLKSLILPDIARDLYVGRGIKLPPTHATVKPRPTVPHVNKKDSNLSRKSSYEFLTSGGKGRVFITSSHTPSADSQFRVPPSTADQHTPSPIKSIEEGGENKPTAIINEIAQEKIPFPSVGTELVDPFKDVSITLPEEDNVLMQNLLKHLPQKSDGKRNIEEFKQLAPLLISSNLNLNELRFVRMLFELTSAARHGFGEAELTILTFMIRRLIQMSGASKETFKSLSLNDLYEITPGLLERFHKPSATDSSKNGEISLSSVKVIISEVVGSIGGQKQVDIILNKMCDDLLLSSDVPLTKVNYLLFIPYFISLLTASQLQKQFTSQRTKLILPPL